MSSLSPSWHLALVAEELKFSVLAVDVSVVFSWPRWQSSLQIQEMWHWNKKELSGSIQTEIGNLSIFRKETGCVVTSQSIQAINASGAELRG